MRLTLVPGRWPGAVFAAAGVLLALPSLFWPVVVFTSINPAENEIPARSFTQGLYSWGKFLELTRPSEGTPFEVPNTLSLVVLVMSLTIGAGGAVAWGALGREPGRSLGITGASFVTATQLVFVAQWLAQRQNGWNEENDSYQVELQPAGWLQAASLVVLLVAIGLMLWQPLRAVSAPVWRRWNGQESEAVTSSAGFVGEEVRPPPTALARRRDGAGDADQVSPRANGPTVGFSDVGPERSRTAERPQPPR